MINSELECHGDVQVSIKYKDQKEKIIKFKNTILRKGRMALAASLANELGGDFDFFINRMIFGNGGTTGTGVPKQVNTERNGLFGSAVVSKPIISNIDPNNPTQVVFTSVITFEEGNGETLNEMALQMHTGDFYSMATFPGITKTNQMQITWNWRLSFI
jgi:hypothetical protein